MVASQPMIRPAPVGRETIPVLDLGPYLGGRPGALESLAAELRRACEDVGFHAIRNHGIPQALIDAVFAEAARFHAQPLADKLAVKVNADNIGYLPIQGDLLRSDGSTAPTRPNLNEAFFVRKERPADHPEIVNKVRFRGRNQWPDGLPGFRATVVDYFSAMESLARRLLPVYARALDLPADYFLPFFGEPHATLRMSHYPPQPAARDDEFGLAAHTDSGFMTLLAPNPIAGLEIRTAAGAWVPAAQPPGTFMVNSGDMLHRWTNERFRSTLHRVTNLSGRERYAVPFFFNPGIDAPIACLPTCQGPDNPPKHPPIVYGDYFASFVGRHYAHQKAATAG